MAPPTKKARIADATTDLDPDGDMYFVLKNADLPPLQYMLSSKVLRDASPVFNKMLGPHFQEGSALRNQQ